MDNVSLVFLPLFINRITETIKQLIAGRAWAKDISDSDWSALVLFVSLVLGVLGVVFLFPSTNLVQGQGASALAEEIVTGVIIGGLANGIDFLGSKINNVLDKGVVTSKATLVSSTTISETAPSA